MRLTNCKEDSVVEKADLIINKDSEHKETTRENKNLNIWSPQYERKFCKGHGNNDKKNEPMLNVDEQQDDKTFKVISDIDDSDEVQEITAVRTPIKMNKPVCVTCNQALALKNVSKKTY